ncbi:MAG: hypothetical protein ACYDBJ_06420 [Aggregatilineales bacterium]
MLIENSSQFPRSVLAQAQTSVPTAVATQGNDPMLTYNQRATGTPSDANPEGKPWAILRDGLIQQAIAHSESIPLGNLSTDPRLGDFGKLASKVTGKAV